LQELLVSLADVSLRQEAHHQHGSDHSVEIHQLFLFIFFLLALLFFSFLDFLLHLLDFPFELVHHDLVRVVVLEPLILWKVPHLVQLFLLLLVFFSPPLSIIIKNLIQSSSVSLWLISSPPLGGVHLRLNELVLIQEGLSMLLHLLLVQGIESVISGLILPVCQLLINDLLRLLINLRVLELVLLIASSVSCLFGFELDLL